MKSQRNGYFKLNIHDIGARGWTGARAAIELELKKELDKIVNKYAVPCHKYILITNVPFSGVRRVGTRDKINSVIHEWRSRIPEIEVWDAVDLSRMLDADIDTRTAYLDDILPGDVLRAFLNNLNFSKDRKKSAFHAYLKSILRSERDAKAEEAGDESGLALEKIFVDLSLKLIRDTADQSTISLVQDLIQGCEEFGVSEDHHGNHVPTDLDETPSSFAFLRANHKSMLLKGGPGAGKSTITQFLTLYHAARLVDRPLSILLAKRLKLTGNVSAEDLEAHCQARFPLRIELRRYAQWMADQGDSDTFLAHYLAERISRGSSEDLKMIDIFGLASENPILLILDGLDEVPHPLLREKIFNELQTFLDRCEGELCDIQTILASRLQGYRGEFDGFVPVEWHVIDLDQEDFDDYADRWLMERIPDNDERQDAQRRIAEGMQATAVKQMATTLLQATVMLTIARRKHAIPHARHKLYEKYVEVIFERERNKLTVRKRNDELLRLHEFVGYELIRKMELAEGVRTLGGEEFKQCVQQVIKDYGPSDLGNESISEVVDDIVTLAKDRLCLLAGKGDNQQDVDFVIQPFREYFAAAYLAHHEEADPDRVYENLVTRRHIWANVLQFYAAFQSKAQQKNWISEADGTGTNPNKYSDIVDMTRKRRALLRVLPEFERPKNDYVLRVFQNLFDASTRWTWINRDGTGDLLEAFAPGESYGILKKLFRQLTFGDVDDLYTELNLLAKVAGEKNNKSICSTLNEFCQNEQLQTVAVRVAFNNNLGVRLENCQLKELVKILDYSLSRNPNRFSGKFLSELSEDQILDIAFLKGARSIWLNQEAHRLWFSDLSECLLPRNFLEFDFHSILYQWAPYVSDRQELVSDELIQCLEQSQSTVAPYVKALLLAIKNPKNPNYYEEAVVQEKKLVEIPRYFSVADQLGPNPKLFNTIEDWVAAREIAFSISKKALESCLAHNSGEFSSWLMTSIHPDVWDEFKPIVPKKEFNRLKKQCYPILKSLSSHHFNPFRIRGWKHFKYGDSFELCNCVVGVINKHGNSCVWIDQHLIHSLVDSEFKSVKASEAHELLQKASITKLPSSWSGLIIRICSSVENIDVNKLLNFWQYQYSEGIVLIGNVQQPQETIIKQLLDVDTADAVHLAAFIASNRQDFTPERLSIDIQLEEIIAHKLCELIESSSDDDGRKLNIRLLMNLAPNSCELTMWANNENIDSISGDIWQVNRVADRLREIVDSKRTIDSEKLREKFGIFIVNRTQYPFQVSLAALDALLRLDEISTTPLRDKDWQG